MHNDEMNIERFLQHYHKSDNLYTLHKDVNNFYATSTKMSHIIPLKSHYHTIVIFYQFMAFQHLSTKFSTYNHFDNITLVISSHSIMLSCPLCPYNLYTLYNALYALSTPSTIAPMPHTHINIPLTPKCPTNQFYTPFRKCDFQSQITHPMSLCTMHKSIYAKCTNTKPLCTMHKALYAKCTKPKSTQINSIQPKPKSLLQPLQPPVCPSNPSTHINIPLTSNPLKIPLKTSF